MTPVVLSPFAHRLLIAIVFLFIPLSIVAPHSIVWAIIVSGLIGVYYSRKQPLVALPSSLTILLLLIPLWGLMTVLWANSPLNALTTSLKVLALVTLGLYWCRLTLSLPQATRKFLIQALIGGLILGLCFFIIDTWSGNLWQAFWKRSSAKAFAQGSLMVSLAAWPALLWVFRQPYSLFFRFSLASCLLFSVFWVLLQIDCDTSFMGLFLGICAFLGTFFLPRITSFSMRLFVPLFIMSFPFISLYAFKPEHIPTYNSYIHTSSYLDRLYIWNEVATSIFDHPWRGIGMDGTRHHEKIHLTHDWSYTDENDALQEKQTARFSIHPHNAILQLWLELGFFGILLGILLAYQVLYHIYCSTLHTLEKAVSAGLFTGVFLIVWVNLGFWQNWWISGLWMMIGLTLMLFKGKKETNEKLCNS